jgi:hypothetical protein
MYYQLAQGGYEFGGTLSQEVDNTAWGKILAEWRQIVDHNGIAIYEQPGRLLWFFTDNSEKPMHEGDFAGVFLSARTAERFDEAANKYGFTKH